MFSVYLAELSNLNMRLG